MFLAYHSIFLLGKIHGSSGPARTAQIKETGFLALVGFWFYLDVFMVFLSTSHHKCELFIPLNSTACPMTQKE